MVAGIISRWEPDDDFGRRDMLGIKPAQIYETTLILRQRMTREQRKQSRSASRRKQAAAVDHLR